MCGRYTLRATAGQWAEFFSLLPEVVTVSGPRWNVSPTQMVPIVRWDDAAAERAWRMARWGLIPSWAKDEKIGNRLLNARGETLAEKPSFRAAFKKRRCLIPADGYYEWSAITPKKKQPYLYSLRDGGLLAFAGLWETWHSPAGQVIESCSIITTGANELAAQCHDRMPVILDPDQFTRWLDPREQDTAGLSSLLVSYPAERMQAEAVSSVINKAGVEVDPRA